MPIWQLCANLLIPNCLRSNFSYSPLAALELYVKDDKSRKNNEIHRGKRPIRRILFDRFKPSSYLCVIVIARESESEPVVHHNREIGKH